MPFRIVRNDITKMKTDAIVNTANEYPEVGPGCDRAVYEAAGYDELLAYRKEHIGFVKQGEAFLTPGFNLPAKYIIHAVSPLFVDGSSGEEELLRSCYRKSLTLAKENGIRSIAFPLISTGSFGYPKEEGMRIAVDEIHAFLLSTNMLVCLVVFDEKATRMGRNLYPDLEETLEKLSKQYHLYIVSNCQTGYIEDFISCSGTWSFFEDFECFGNTGKAKGENIRLLVRRSGLDSAVYVGDTQGDYNSMENSEVYKRAIVDKKVFSKIKKNPNYHPQKLTALCLCIGAKLNLDESKDLLARAGYALSPCDKTDIIFSYFIENEIYDMIELDIQLEEHGLPCIIT